MSSAPLKVDVVTIFPAMVRSSLSEGIVGRAIARGVIDVGIHDLRDHTTDRHRVVDDVPFGGGPGMVLKPEPLFRAVAHVREQRGSPGAIAWGMRACREPPCARSWLSPTSSARSVVPLGIFTEPSKIGT